MNFNIVFRLLILTIRLLKRLSKTNRHIGIKKTFINREKFFQLSLSLWIYGVVLSIILCLVWVFGSQVSYEIININISKFHNIFNSKLALISFFLLFLMACLPIKYLKESLLILMFLFIISFFLSTHVIGTCAVSLFNNDNFSDLNFEKRRSGKGIPLLSVFYYWTCFASPLVFFMSLFNFIPLWFLIKNNK